MVRLAAVTGQVFICLAMLWSACLWAQGDQAEEIPAPSDRSLWLSSELSRRTERNFQEAMLHLAQILRDAPGAPFHEDILRLHGLLNSESSHVPGFRNLFEDLTSPDLERVRRAYFSVLVVLEAHGRGKEILAVTPSWGVIEEIAGLEKGSFIEMKENQNGRSKMWEDARAIMSANDPQTAEGELMSWQRLRELTGWSIPYAIEHGMIAEKQAPETYTKGFIVDYVTEATDGRIQLVFALPETEPTLEGRSQHEITGRFRRDLDFLNRMAKRHAGSLAIEIEIQASEATCFALEQGWVHLKFVESSSLASIRDKTAALGKLVDIVRPIALHEDGMYRGRRRPGANATRHELVQFIRRVARNQVRALEEKSGLQLDQWDKPALKGVIDTLQIGKGPSFVQRIATNPKIKSNIIPIFASIHEYRRQKLPGLRASIVTIAEHGEPGVLELRYLRQLQSSILVSGEREMVGLAREIRPPRKIKVPTEEGGMRLLKPGEPLPKDYDGRTTSSQDEGDGFLRFRRNDLLFLLEIMDYDVWDKIYERKEKQIENYRKLLRQDISNNEETYVATESLKAVNGVIYFIPGNVPGEMTNELRNAFSPVLVSFINGSNRTAVYNFCQRFMKRPGTLKNKVTVILYSDAFFENIHDLFEPWEGQREQWAAIRDQVRPLSEAYETMRYRRSGPIFRVADTSKEPQWVRRSIEEVQNLLDNPSFRERLLSEYGEAGSLRVLRAELHETNRNDALERPIEGRHYQLTLTIANGSDIPRNVSVDVLAVPRAGFAEDPDNKGVKERAERAKEKISMRESFVPRIDYAHVDMMESGHPMSVWLYFEGQSSSLRSLRHYQQSLSVEQYAQLRRAVTDHFIAQLFISRHYLHGISRGWLDVSIHPERIWPQVAFRGADVVLQDVTYSFTRDQGPAAATFGERLMQVQLSLWPDDPRGYFAYLSGKEFRVELFPLLMEYRIRLRELEVRDAKDSKTYRDCVAAERALRRQLTREASEIHGIENPYAERSRSTASKTALARFYLTMLAGNAFSPLVSEEVDRARNHAAQLLEDWARADPHSRALRAEIEMFISTCPNNEIRLILARVLDILKTTDSVQIRLQHARARVEMLSPKSLEEAEVRANEKLLSQARAKRVLELLLILAEARGEVRDIEIDLAHRTVDENYGRGYFQAAARFCRRNAGSSGSESTLVRLGENIERQLNRSSATEYVSETVLRFPSRGSWHDIWQVERRSPEMRALMEKRGGLMEARKPVMRAK